MLRRLASLGHSAAEDSAAQEPMSPSPGDDQPPQETRSSGGGLAGMFKGLAGGGKLTKSPPVIQQPFQPMPSSQSLAQPSDNLPPVSALHGLSPEQTELFKQLKDGQLGDRISAANSLRSAIADFPLSPVRCRYQPPPFFHYYLI